VELEEYTEVISSKFNNKNGIGNNQEKMTIANDLNNYYDVLSHINDSNVKPQLFSN